MVTYISLFKYTQKGIEDIGNSPERLEAAKKLFTDAGASIKSFYLSVGRYDGIVIFEAPDDETMTQVLLRVGSLGNIRTETLRAFTEDEYRSILSGLWYTATSWTPRVIAAEKFFQLKEQYSKQ